MGLKEDLDQLTVSSLNLRPPVTVSRDGTVRDAVEAMRQAELGCAFMVDENQKVVGIFSEGMLRHALNESPGVINEPLKEQMVARVPWVTVTDPICEVLEAMEEHHIRFIAVLDENHRLTAITGQKSLMEFIADYFPHEVLTQDPTGITESARREGA